MLHIPSVKINNIETKIFIAMVPDDHDYSKDDLEPPQNPFGVRVVIEVRNWTTGNNLKLQSAGLWGIDINSDMSYVVEVAKDQFEEIKQEYPDICKNLVVDDATPVRFV